VTPYVDASVVVALFREEDGSALARGWLINLELQPQVSSLAVGEVRSAFSRLVRRNELEHTKALEAFARVDMWIEEQVSVLSIANADILSAADLVRTPFPRLLMPDAIHLAICRRLNLTLVTFDKDLLTIAEREGVAAITPA
jgi:uncharacterized protein